MTKQLEDLYADGFRSIAVCLIHAYNFQGLSPAQQPWLGELGANQRFQSMKNG